MYESSVSAIEVENRPSFGSGGESPRGQVVRESKNLVITEISDFRTTSGYSPCPLIKPAIGTRFTDVWRSTASEIADSERRFSELLAEHDLVVQEYVPEIRSGKRSIVFFDGEYTRLEQSPDGG